MSEQQKNDVLLSEETTTSEGQTSVAVQTEQAQAQTVPPGAQLASFRKTKNLSVEDVASYLKLAPRQVHAIEADDYASLPGMAITRGFIRTYAKLLGVDAAPLLDGLPKQEMRLGSLAGSDRVQPSTFHESSLPLRDRNKIVPVAIAIAVAAAVAAGGLYFWHKTEGGAVSPLSWLSSDKTEAAEQEAAPQVVASNTNEVEQTAPAESVEAPVTSPKFEMLPVAGVRSTTPDPAAVVPVTTSSVLPAPAAAPKVPATPAPVAVVTPATPVVAPVAPVEQAKPVIKVSNSKDLLRLKMREDAWVEIRRADNSVMFSRLLQAGTTESFDVPEPLQLVVGNASGVEATLRGEPLSLAVSKNNVARINLK